MSLVQADEVCDHAFRSLPVPSQTAEPSCDRSFPIPSELLCFLTVCFGFGRLTYFQIRLAAGLIGIGVFRVDPNGLVEGVDSLVQLAAHRVLAAPQIRLDFVWHGQFLFVVSEGSPHASWAH